ncbi:hypothetical protein [Symmachiella dynata]|uniref:Uncharacterized protein n=1 Tax=Symmachiella dynata TaxID=2527995 RepID=A0A517ZWB7_9PLAN|nr:hypothetical protein [Symmachiella dynata]QDU46792.1 hypothetical protein Mal52_53140 [Symmachiella dynata]
MRNILQIKWVIAGILAVAPLAATADAQDVTGAFGDAQNVTGKENILGRRDLGAIVKQQDLDSYWLDQRAWYEYGYRPHVNLDRIHYPPRGVNSYSTGPAWEVGDKLDLGDPAAKYKIQLGKDGTWH